MVKPRVLIFLGLLGQACGPVALESTPAPNVLLISIDSLRQDRLGCYGHQLEFANRLDVSPNIDTLAKQGTRFINAFSSSSWTLPAHASLMTGLSDYEHGVESSRFKIDPKHPVLAESFQDAGYATLGVFSGSFLDSRHGFGRGFNQYQSAILDAQQTNALLELERQKISAEDPDFLWTAERLTHLRKIVLRYDHSSERVVDRAIEMLGGSAEDRAPFFLFTHFFDVHHDYLPERVDELLAKSFDPSYEGPWNGKDWLDKLRPQSLKNSPLSERDLAHIKAMYDAEIHLVDRQVGRLFSYLQDTGQWDNTIVVLVSDHGEEFFEHGNVTHGKNLHDESIRIPLIVKGIAGLPSTTVEVRGIQAVAELIGDQAGLHIHHSDQPDFLGTFSRLKVGTGSSQALRDSWRDEEFSLLRAFEFDQESQDLQLARHPISGQPAILIYNHNTDPTETHPIPINSPRARLVKARFEQDLERLKASNKKLEHSVEAKRLAEEYSKEEMELLEELGYAH